MKKIVFSLCVALAASSALAFDLGVAPRIGTQGYGLDLVTPVSGNLNLRLGAYTYKAKKDIESDDATFAADLALKNIGLMTDYHLFSGHLRITAGGFYNGNRLDIATKPNASGNYVFNGNTYNANDFRGSGELTFKKFAPYIGIGGGNAAASNGNWSFLWDIGALYMNEGKVKLNAEILNPAATPAMQTQFQNDLKTEEADLQDKVGKYKWYPVIAFGVGYKF